jgi:hypothetical protein
MHVALVAVFGRGKDAHDEGTLKRRAVDRKGLDVNTQGTQQLILLISQNIDLSFGNVG